jgi:hypothetical protein
VGACIGRLSLATLFALSLNNIYIHFSQQQKQNTTNYFVGRFRSGGWACIGLHPPTHCLVEQCNCGVNNVGGGQPSGWWAEFSLGSVQQRKIREIPVAHFGTRVSSDIFSLSVSPNLFLLPLTLLETSLGVITPPRLFWGPPHSHFTSRQSF